MCTLAISMAQALAWTLPGDCPSARAVTCPARGLAIARPFYFLRIEPEEARYLPNSSERTAPIRLFPDRMNRQVRNRPPTGAGSSITPLSTLRTIHYRLRG